PGRTAAPRSSARAPRWAARNPESWSSRIHVIYDGGDRSQLDAGCALPPEARIIPRRIARMPLDPDQSRLASLLSRAALGDRAAFAELYGATRSKLFAVSLRIVRERSLAEEVLQDSF